MDEVLENKYKGYKINDLSESLGSALNQESNDKIVQSFTGSYLHYLESIDWIKWIPSLHTTLVIIYFLLLLCILGGISTFMWNKYDIKGKSQSNKTSLEKQLLGTGKYAQYVNAAVAFKIYQEEMAKDDTDDEDSDDSDGDSDGNDDGANSVNTSTLIGGYHKSKKLRARTIRKQQIREQRENYQRYKKRLEYEKQLKRYKKMKEKKTARKMAKKLKAQKKNEKRNKNKTEWFHSIQRSFTSWFNDNDVNTMDDVHEKKGNNKNNKTKVIENKNQKQNIANTKCKADKMKNHRKSLEDMLINDCGNKIVIDLQEYYLDKIKSSEVYCKIVKDLKSFIKMIKSLALKHKECEGMIDDNAMIYFRWNKECEQNLVRWIQETGKCDVQSTGEKMIAISREMFKHKTQK